MSKKRLDGFLITDLLNIQYLTGFQGSSGVLFVGLNQLCFFTDFRYKYECESLLKKEKLIIVKSDAFSEIKKRLRLTGVKRLGFEYGALYQVFDRLKKNFQLKALRNVVEKLRMLKEREEIPNIKLAIKRAEEAFRLTKKWIRPGVTERKVALLLERNLEKLGCRTPAFDIIVASGINSARPHAHTSEKKIQKGDLIVVDWGGEANGYKSDMTRTFLIHGSDLAQKKRMYQTVLRANKTGITKVKSGIACKDIDKAARDIIQKEGYGDFFGHGTGHGVGLDVHEMPSLSPTSKDICARGMVFTVEPGVYIPDIGGVRIEDMVWMERGAGKCLTTLPKRLEIL